MSNLFSGNKVRAGLAYEPQRKITNCVTVLCKKKHMYRTISQMMRDNPPRKMWKVNQISHKAFAIVATVGVLGVLNPLSPSIKLQILLLCFHTFLTKVVGRSC